MPSMLGHFCKQWAPKFTCLNAHVKPGTGHCSTWVFCSLINNWVVKLLLKQGSRLGRTEVAPCGQKVTPPSLPGKKNPWGWGPPGTSTAQNIQKSAWGCQFIFTLGEKRISCHLTLNFEHLQTNAKPAGHLLLSVFCLMLALSLSPEVLLQWKDPLETPTFPNIYENTCKVAAWYRCQIIPCKSISSALISSSCKIKNSCHRQTTTEDENVCSFISGW